MVWIMVWLCDEGLAFGWQNWDESRISVGKNWE